MKKYQQQWYNNSVAPSGVSYTYIQQRHLSKNLEFKEFSADEMKIDDFRCFLFVVINASPLNSMPCGHLLEKNMVQSHRAFIHARCIYSMTLIMCIVKVYKLPKLYTSELGIPTIMLFS